MLSLSPSFSPSPAVHFQSSQLFNGDNFSRQPSTLSTPSTAATPTTLSTSPARQVQRTGSLSAFFNSLSCLDHLSRHPPQPLPLFVPRAPTSESRIRPSIPNRAPQAHPFTFPRQTTPLLSAKMDFEDDMSDPAFDVDNDSDGYSPAPVSRPIPLFTTGLRLETIC